MPTALPGATKYGTTGGCTANLLLGLTLPKAITESIAKWGNMGIAKKTWSTYKTAQVMLMKCGTETKINMDLPLSMEQTLVFINWLAETRNLKHATINSYLAGIRQLHIIKGMQEPELRTGLVKLVLKGIANRDGITARKRNWSGRLPMTKNAMLLFERLIKRSSLNEQDKALTWTVATVAFAGAFRIHEILARTESTFDPNFTLLAEDVTTSKVDSQEILHFKLKCPKESKAATPTMVDLYRNSGPLCPVSAFKKWVNLKHRDPKLPMFRRQCGTPLTGTKMNTIMKQLLGPYTDKSIGFFATHSFRIGIATMLGQAGFEDQEIMTTGRWSSRVFERYIKLARTRRNIVQKTM